MSNLKKKQKRVLTGNKKLISNTKNESPYVFEPDNKIVTIKLPEFLSKNSDEIFDKIYKHGAVLLRGFQISSETAFEQAVTSITGFRLMDDYFMAEKGRTVVDGCQYVYHTNKTFKTGGTLKLGGFHTENHYSCDVPHFISFWCRKPSLLGGETGLVNMAKVYEDLSVDIKTKLNKNTFFTISFAVSELARRYNISESLVMGICTEFGLTVDKNEKGEDNIVVYKPSVIDHPATHKPSLVVNISAEVPGLDQALVDEFQDCYVGLKWKFHRAAWKKFPNLVLMSQIKLKELLINGFLRKMVFTKNKEQLCQAFPVSAPPNRMGSAFTHDDIIDLARSMRNHFSSFKWQKGDILLIDNLQMAHAGMPGLGPRILRTVLANPLPMHYLKSSSGYQHLDNVAQHISLASRIAGVPKK